MINRTIDVPLTISGLHNAVRDLKQFHESFIDQTKIYVNRLMSLGYDVAKVRLADAKATARSDIREDTSNEVDFQFVDFAGKDVFTAVVTLSGERALFIEFGAGATLGYGHPKPMGYGPGTYNPSSTNWSNPLGWWYKNDSNEWRHTYGNKPYAPIYGAYERIAMDFKRIARETFY